eukprot:213604-Chlamydomonas_euryale.AAC.15
MGRPTESATPSGRPLKEADLGSGLRNRPAEVRRYWTQFVWQWHNHDSALVPGQRVLSRATF